MTALNSPVPDSDKRIGGQERMRANEALLTADYVRSITGLVRGDPLAEFHEFRRNTRWYAELWLRRDGEVHPQEHWRITERLDPWRRRVTEAGLAGALLDEIGPEVPPEPPAPKQVWAAPTMPTRAAQSPTGEQVEGCRYPNTRPISPQIPECAEAIETWGNPAAHLGVPTIAERSPAAQVAGRKNVGWCASTGRTDCCKH